MRSENRIDAHSLRDFAVVEGPIPTVIGVIYMSDKILVGDDYQPVLFARSECRLVVCIPGGSLPCLGDTDDINALHRTVRRVDVAGQRLGAVQAIGKVHSQLDSLAEIGFNQPIGLGIFPNVRGVGPSVGIHPYPLVSVNTGHTVLVLHGGCDGRQFQPNLCIAAESRRAGRRVLRPGHVDGHQVGVGTHFRTAAHS